MRTLALTIGPIPLLTLLGYLAARDLGLMIGLAVGSVSSLLVLVGFATVYTFDAAGILGLLGLLCVLPGSIVMLQFVSRSSDKVMPAAVFAPLLATAGIAALLRSLARSLVRRSA